MAIIIVIFAVMVLAGICCFFFAMARAEHKATFPLRIERNENTLRDLGVCEFEGLKCEEVEFAHYKGAFYYKEKGGDVIFLLHGYGAGHKAYATEINFFCDNGYTVFGFDYSGCCSSGGRTGTFYTAVQDALTASKFLQTKISDEQKIYLFGHSWGAYVALIVASRTPCEKVVAVCPFDSAGKVMAKICQKNKFNKALKPFRKIYMTSVFGKNADCSSYKVAEKTDKDTLIIFGENDFLVPPYDFKNEKIKRIIAKGKGHNPYNTEQAERYLNDCLLQLKTAEDKQEFLKTVDYKKITEEDGEFMRLLLDFLKA